MRNLKKLCVACVLTLALALSAFAGNIEAGVTAPPPPPQETIQGNMSTTVTGQMTTGFTGTISTGVTATDPATDIFLNLLQSLLSLF